MRARTLYRWVGGFLLVAACILNATETRADESKTQASNPKIQVEPERIELGTISDAWKVTRSFIVRNMGGKELRIIRAMSAYVDVAPKTATIAPGKECTFTVEYNPRHMRGYQEKKIAIACNDPHAISNWIFICATVYEDSISTPSPDMDRLIDRAASKHKPECEYRKRLYAFIGDLTFLENLGKDNVAGALKYVMMNEAYFCSCKWEKVR